MATTYTENGGARDGSNKEYTFSFPYIKTEDVYVALNGTTQATTKYAVSTSPTKITFNNTSVDSSVQESSGAPKSGVNVRVFRDTDVDAARAVYSVGSSVRAVDLNDNQDQVLFALQEEQNQTGSIVTTTYKGLMSHTDKVKLDGIETAATADQTGSEIKSLLVGSDKLGSSNVADDAIDSQHYAADSIDTEHYAPNSVDSTALAADAVTSSQLADNSVNSEHYVDLSIDEAHIAAGAISLNKMANNSVASGNIVNDTIVNADINTGAAIEFTKLENLDSAKILVGNGSNKATEVAVSGDVTISNTGAVTIAAGAIENGMMANNSVASGNIVNGTIATTDIAADAIDGTLIADNAINSEHYTDASIDHEHLANDIIDGDNIQDDAIASEHIANAAVQNDHIAAATIQGGKIANLAISSAQLATNSVTVSKIDDAELTTLAGMQSGTASILAGSTALTSTLSELNLLDGKSIVTSISSPTDVQLPTAQAVEERIVDLVTDVGGFRPIANETSFPATNPDPEDNAGTIVSVKALASNLTSNGSGVATIANGAGSGNTVTITGMANNDTIEAGKGILVETTTTSGNGSATPPRAYTFHRETLAPADITAAQSAVDDFNDRYRILASGTNINTVGSLDDGDLLWDSNVNKMKVYDASASQWTEVTSVGDYKILTVVPDGATSGTPNYANLSFDLRDGSNAASITSVGQLLVSVNGVLQKPNSTSWSSSNEGFHLEGADGIKFCTAPGAGASVFVTLIGSATSVNVPATNSIVEDAIQTNVVSEEKLKIHQAPSDGKFLKYTSANGMEWGDAGDTDKIEELNTSVECVDSGTDGKVKFTIDGTELARIDGALYLGESIPLRLGAIGTQDNTLEFIGSPSGTYHTFRSNTKDVWIEAKGVNNNSNTVHDWIKLIHSPSAGTTATKVELYASDVKRLETSTTGVTVTGTVAATAYTGDGSALTGVAAASADGCMYKNTLTISNAHTIAATEGAHSVGPITVGNTVTVQGRWVIS